MTAKDDDPGFHDVMRRDIEHMYVRGEEDGSVIEGLARALPRPIPSIVITLMRKSARGVGESLRALPGALDETVGRYPVKLELRLDPLTGLSERVSAAALVLKLGVPVVFTLRTRTEGGLSTATDPERQEFLTGLLTALKESVPRGSLLDVEAQNVATDPEGWGRVLRLARDRGFHILLSQHDLDRSPERAGHLLPPDGLLDTAPGGPALLWKQATRTRSWSQVLAQLRALRVGNLHMRRHALMGLDAIESRLLAPFFGSPLVYAAVDAERAAAQGQLPFADLARVWARWGVTPDDAGLVADVGDDGAGRPRWCLLGRPAWHSLSPAMHNAAARDLGLPARYFPLEIPTHTSGGTERELLVDTLASLPALGVTAGNVTVPFKNDIAGLMHRLEGEAEPLAAVNTFRFDGDRLIGTNTDPAGITGALADIGTDRPGSVLVLGAGGSAAAALHALRETDRIIVSARTRTRAETLSDRLDAAIEVVDWNERVTAAKSADLIINTTPVGMAGGPDPDGTPLDAAAIRAEVTVLDLVYAAPTDPGRAPGVTRLLAEASAKGAKTQDGLAVLLHQGAAAFRIWTGEEPPVEAMRAALVEAQKIPFPDSVRAKAQESEVTA
ncbi:MAG: type I 3-dehydroquinate dehydratase [Euryarchaeota archaeon]|nr:type I 3-dehydroquinate dehydratase [Euryarchaeota archaeon]